MIRVLLADDHPVVRAGLSAVFSGEDDIRVVGAVDRAVDAEKRCARQPIDIGLLDLLCGGHGLQGAEATRRHRALENPPCVLILTNYDSDADILGAIEAGASGYLLKDAPPSELIAAVRAAARGETALAPLVAHRLEARSSLSADALTAREIEVLKLVAEGRTNRRIGQELFLSEATIKSHLVHIFTKLGVGSRTEAVAMARSRGALR